MEKFQQDFIQLAYQYEALKFGQFTLKSGRVSPYFFNIAAFNDGHSLYQLGQFYASTIKHAKLDFDMLFGPAYKGIPLAVTTSIALKSTKNIPVCFNRKEVKDHGEGGYLMGAPLEGKVLIIDDVVTAGTAIREASNIIKNHNAEIAGIITALDRQEIGQGKTSATQELSQTLNVPVVSIINLDHLIEYCQQEDNTHSQVMLDYRKKYGVE